MDWKHQAWPSQLWIVGADNPDPTATCSRVYREAWIAALKRAGFQPCRSGLYGMSALRQRPTAQEVMSSQNIETIRAWMDLQRLSVSRAAIRGAYDSLKRLWGYTTQDINGVFMSYRNGDLRPGPGKPIPTFEDGAERLAWEVVNDAIPWLPLANEQRGADEDGPCGCVVVLLDAYNGPSHSGCEAGSIGR